MLNLKVFEVGATDNPPQVEISGILSCKNRDDIPRPGESLLIGDTNIVKKLDKAELLLHKVLDAPNLPPFERDRIFRDILNYFEEEK